MSRRLKDRMCQWGSCRNEFDWRWCGLGAKKFCDEHMEIARKTREKLWYEKNKESVKVKNKINYEKNKEKRRQQMKDYYVKNPHLKEKALKRWNDNIERDKEFDRRRLKFKIETNLC